jgi:hypothetical protein
VVPIVLSENENVNVYLYDNHIFKFEMESLDLHDLERLHIFQRSITIQNDNIEIDLQEVGHEDVDWFQLA